EMRSRFGALPGGAVTSLLAKSVLSSSLGFVTACPPAITTWSGMLGHLTAFLTIPIGNGRAYCYCDVVSSSGEDRQEDLGQLFSAYAEPVPELLGSVAEPD